MGRLAKSLTGEEHWLQELDKGGKTNNSSSFVSSKSDGNNIEQESFPGLETFQQSAT